MPKLQTAPHADVAIAVDSLLLRQTISQTLEQRGVRGASVPPDRGLDKAMGVIAYAPNQPLGPEAAIRLAPVALRGAEQQRPLVLLAAWQKNPPTSESMAAIAFLQTHGALICTDPDVWIETLVLLSTWGVPKGPRIAIVAPTGTYLAAAAASLATEAQSRGPRVWLNASDSLFAASQGTTDVVLIDAASTPMPESPSTLVIPVAARAELTSRSPMLAGLRAALGAVELAGRFARRLADDLGRPTKNPFLADVDGARTQRQISRLGNRAGDHETKVMLSSYGVAITRQAVATTPSAATRIAKKAGFPVDLKPWGDDVPAEHEGCPLETQVNSAADVRRAFSLVCSARASEAVIVRQSPPAGRALRVRVRTIGELGPILFADFQDATGPIAATAPLHPNDAEEIARRLVTTRAGDDHLNRDSLVNLLIRASWLVNDTRITDLELNRVVVTAEDALVVDARAHLREAGQQLEGLLL